MVECLHIAHAFERADEFDVIHNSFDFLPLTYSGLVETPVLTTIHGFSSRADPAGLPALRRDAPPTSRSATPTGTRACDYLATIHHGIDTDAFSLHPSPGGYLLFFGRIHPDKGTAEAIDVAAGSGPAARDRRDRPGPAATSTSGSRRGSTASRCPSSARERRGAVGAPRRRPRAAAPDRVRRAVRLQRRRGDGVRHTRDRVRAWLDGRADRGRTHRLPRRRRRGRGCRRRPGGDPRPCGDPRSGGRPDSASDGWSTSTSSAYAEVRPSAVCATLTARVRPCVHGRRSRGSQESER